MTIAPFTPDDLGQLTKLEPASWEVMLARLRWHLSTPNAVAVKAVFGEAPMVGLGTAVAHEGTGWIGDLLMMPCHASPEMEHALLTALMKELHAMGCASVGAVVVPSAAELFAAQGFAPEGAVLRYAGGASEVPTLDEVQLFEPHHTLGLLHLDRLASGEDRRTMLLEHSYLDRVYVEKGRVRGAYLPLLGNGLQLADRPDVGEELLRWHLPYVTEHGMPEENAVARAFLEERGYAVQGRLPWLRCGAALPWRAGLNYGRVGERSG